MSRTVLIAAALAATLPALAACNRGTQQASRDHAVAINTTEADAPHR